MKPRRVLRNLHNLNLTLYIYIKPLSCRLQHRRHRRFHSSRPLHRRYHHDYQRPYRWFNKYPKFSEDCGFRAGITMLSLQKPQTVSNLIIVRDGGRRGLEVGGGWVGALVVVCSRLKYAAGCILAA